MLLADQRIELDARPVIRSPAPIEAVMIGHCPSADGLARWDRLARDDGALAEIAALGWSVQVARLRVLYTGTATPETPDPDLRALYDLPLPIRSFAYFQTLFPQAFTTPTTTRSRLAGATAWLPAAVQDFFAETGTGADRGQRDGRTLWVIRVREQDGLAAFLPDPKRDLGADLLEPARLRAFGRALLIGRAGLLLLPDLERLLVPAALPDLPRPRSARTLPVFLPEPTPLDDSHHDPSPAATTPPVPPAPKPETWLLPIVRALARWRPDMQCLLAVPLDQQPQDELPAPSAAVFTHLANLARHPEHRASLRHLQLVYPYLRSPDRPLGSPCGLLAGLQARVAERFGPWCSIAGRPLSTLQRPWPVVNQTQATRLREQPGVTVLVQGAGLAGRLSVDDEALCVPCLPEADLHRMRPDERQQPHWRSAEVMRFMGWLRRALQRLGEQMLFDVDPHDPRPEIALRGFFTRLHQMGALRGALPEQAFRIRRLPGNETTLAFEIEIAPAFPIDRLRIAFLHDRDTGRIDTRLSRGAGDLDG
jgi:hypothetical protein